MTSTTEKATRTSAELRERCTEIMEAIVGAANKVIQAGAAGSEQVAIASLDMVAGSGQTRAQFEIAIQLAELNEKLGRLVNIANGLSVLLRPPAPIVPVDTRTVATPHSYSPQACPACGDLEGCHFREAANG